MESAEEPYTVVLDQLAAPIDNEEQAEHKRSLISWLQTIQRIADEQCDLKHQHAKICHNICELIDHVVSKRDELVSDGDSASAEISVYDQINGGLISKEGDQYWISKKRQLTKEWTPTPGPPKMKWNGAEARKIRLILSHAPEKVEKYDELNPSCDLPTRFTLNWERYPQNHNFTLVEDLFTEAKDGFKVAVNIEKCTNVLDHFIGCKVGNADESAWKNDKLTAVGSLQRVLSEKFNSYQFSWYGRLFVAAHYWVLPGEVFLQRLLQEKWEKQAIHGISDEGILAAQHELANIYSTDVTADRIHHLQFSSPNLIRIVGEWAGEAFDQNHPTPTHRRRGVHKDTRKDFVFSIVDDGRAILISDPLPDWDAIGRGSRTFIIDIGLNQEQRGRLISRLTDVATYRMLALRDIAQVESAMQSLNIIGSQISRLYADIALLRVPENRSWLGNIISVVRSTVESKKAITLMNRINLISGALGCYNFFFTAGIASQGRSALDYRKLYYERAKWLREHRIEGYQTLSGFLPRIDSAVNSKHRLQSRYESLRQRLTQANEAVQTILSASENQLMRRFTIAAVFIAALALGVSRWNELPWTQK